MWGTVDTRLPSSTRRGDPVGLRKGELPKTGQGSARIVHDNQVHNACALLPMIARVLVVLLNVGIGSALSLAQSRGLAPGIGAQNKNGGFSSSDSAGLGFVGRSLFDLLTRKQNADGTWIHEVPYPFEKLRQALARACA